MVHPEKVPWLLPPSGSEPSPFHPILLLLCHGALHTHPALSRCVHDLCKCASVQKRQRGARLGNSQRGGGGSARDRLRPWPPHPSQARLPRVAMLPFPCLQSFHFDLGGSVLSGHQGSLDPSLASYCPTHLSCPLQLSQAQPPDGWGPAGHMVLLFRLGEGWP